MRGLLLLVACFVLTGCASFNDGYVRKTGVGSTEQEARHDAYKRAIEYKVGALVLSERETQNYVLHKDEILVHSAGYVDDYRIINTERTGDKVKVTVDVLVSDSKLARYLTGSAKSNTSLEGERNKTQIDTFLNQKQTGDKVLEYVLRGYPHKAYTIKQMPYTIHIDSYRNSFINIPFEVSWNYDYLVSLNEALSVLEDANSKVGRLMHGYWGSVQVNSKGPYSILPSKNKYYFNDLTTVNNVRNTLVDKGGISILTSIKDIQGKTIHTECYNPKYVSYNDGGRAGVEIEINTGKSSGVISFFITSNLMNRLNDASTVELMIVRQQDCR